MKDGFGSVTVLYPEWGKWYTRRGEIPTVNPMEIKL